MLGKTTNLTYAHAHTRTDLKMLVGAKMENRAILKGVPKSEKKVKQLCVDVAGFAPYYLCGERRMKQGHARHTFVWAFTRQLCQGSEQVPLGVKQVRKARARQY